MLSNAIWIGIILVALILKYGFIIPFRDKEKFKIYEQRDKVAMEALNDELDENSLEYKLTMKYINFWIYYTDKDYDFSIVWGNIVNPIGKKQKRQLNSVIKKIQKSNTLSNAMDVAEKQSNRVIGIRGFIFSKVILRIIILVLEVCLGIVNLCDNIIDIEAKAEDKIAKALKESKQIEDNYDNLQQQVMYRNV